jgi:hypothetical protein
MSNDETDQVAPSAIVLGDQIQCPRTKGWFVVSNIRISDAPTVKRAFRRYPRSRGDTYFFSGVDGEMVNFFEGQQAVRRVITPTG